MSTYKPTGSAFYVYDFRRGGRRFLGATGATTKREADAVEAKAKLDAEARIRKEREQRRAPMTVDIAFGRYWSEIGQHAATRGAIEWNLAFALDQIGKDTRLDEITDDDISKMVAVRRTHLTEAGKLDGKQLWKPVSNATVNRTTQVIRRVFTRASTVWKALLPDPPTWNNHLLPEPEERVREATFDEEEALFAAVRPDYHDVMEFASVTGLRKKAALLTWTQVDWDNGLIRWQKKRRRAGQGLVWRTFPISPRVAQILRRCIGHDDVHVFTYVAERTRAGRVKGQRYPITVNGLSTEWRRSRAESGVVDFRWHDWRHTAGTRTLRGSKDLRAVQKMLGHDDIASTLRYAHVLDEDVRDAIETTAADVERRRESRGKSRGRVVGGEDV